MSEDHARGLAIMSLMVAVGIALIVRHYFGDEVGIGSGFITFPFTVWLLDRIDKV